MKVNVEETSKLGRKLSIEVPPETVSAAFDKIYQNLQKSVEIKGFRKGKAPLQTIKSLYKDRVKGDVVSQLVQDFYVKALDEKSLDPVNYPNIQVSELIEEKSFSFTAEFEVRPEVKLQKYDNLTVEKEILELDKTHVEKTIDNIRESHARRDVVLEDRPAATGDFVVMDFEGFRDGQPVPNTKAEEFELELGSNSFIPGFEDGLLGTKPGQEKELHLTFPADYHAKDLAGQPILFKTKIKSLKKKVLPELNDELANRLGFESVEKMKSSLEEDYKNSEEKRINDEFKNRLLKALVESNPVDVPKSMKDEQKQLLINDMQNRFKGQGFDEISFKEYTEKWDADFESSATFMIQSSFLIHAVAEKENLAATTEDLNKKIEEYATQTGIELSKLKSFYNEKDNRSRLLYKLTEDKVVDFLKSKANIKDVAKAKLKA